MDVRTILSKVITLIYRSRLVNNLENDDLIKTVLNTIKTDAPEFNFMGNNSVKNFKETCLTLLEEKEPIPKEVLIPQVSILLENDPKLLGVLKESISADYDEASNKRVVANHIKALNNYYREQMATDLIGKMSYELKFNRNKIGNFSDYLKNALSELEPLTNMVSSIRDPALVSEVDFENPDSLNTVFDEVKTLNDNTGIYRFGWQALNTMFQGGIRLGESIFINALPHRYKTGGSLSMFAQIAVHNKPIITEKNKDKKPLLLRISFEDSLTNNLQFLYQYLKAADGQPVGPKDFQSLSSEEMTKYILPKLTATGFHIKMLRVDPSQWSYSQLFNKIIEIEAQGYAVHVLMLDYIGMMPTTGCTQGPAGTDKRDLLRRVRNFCSARGIAFMSPLQLSTEAKQMLRNGVPEHQFVNEVAEKGMYSDSRQLDQEMDGEVYIHLFTHKRKKYLAFRRGKHRIPTVISDDDKYFILPFPGLNIPILPDVDKDDTSMKVLPRGEDSNGGNILEEVLN